VGAAEERPVVADAIYSSFFFDKGLLVDLRREPRLVESGLESMYTKVNNIFRSEEGCV
jgi:hypothetical protein